MKSKTYLLAVVLGVFGLGISSTETAAAPTPIAACGTISSPGSYVLTTNLTATGPFACLDVIANNVNINLDGFMIQGNGTGRGIHVGIVAGLGAFGVAIRNGTIRAFAIGLDFEDSNAPMAERITAISNSSAGLIANNTAIVKDSVFIVNGTGIFLQPGSPLALATGALLTGNYVSGNQTGIIVGCPSNILGNTIVNNAVANLVLNGDPLLCNVEHTLAP